MACASTFKLQAAPLMAGITTNVVLVTEEDVEFTVSGSVPGGTFDSVDGIFTSTGVYGGASGDASPLLTFSGSYVLGLPKFGVSPEFFDVYIYTSGSVTQRFEYDLKPGGHKESSRSGTQNWVITVRLGFTAAADGVSVEVLWARATRAATVDWTDWEGDALPPYGSLVPYGYDKATDTTPPYIEVSGTADPSLVPWLRSYVPGKLRSKITGI